MRILKQSTARDILIFMTDSADHVTGKTGLTLTITASKAGAAFGSISPTVTERGNGWYALALTTSHTDTLGDFALHITSSGADPSDVAMEVRARLTDDLASQASLDTVDDFIDTEVAAIKAKTDNLPSDPADASDIAAAFSTVNSTLATIAAYIDTEVAAIKAKTDNLPSDPADASDIAASFSSLASTLSTIAAYVDTEVAAIKAKTDNLPSDPADASDIAALFVKVRKYFQLIARKDAAIATDNATELTELNASGGSGAGAFANTTDALEAIRDRGDAEWITGAGGGGGGSGARTVTITVNDGSSALQNANVRVIQGAENYVLPTNASGVAVFSLDDATWSVAITKPGYLFTPTTLVVNGTETQTYSMTALTITPSAPGQVTGYLTIFDVEGEPEEGAEIHLQQLQPVSGTGIGYDGAIRTEESGADGVVEFPGMFPGGRYNIWRGTDTTGKKQFTLSASATDPAALASFVGSP